VSGTLPAVESFLSIWEGFLKENYVTSSTWKDLKRRKEDRIFAFSVQDEETDTE
jgi:hypothetical protein